MLFGLPCASSTYLLRACSATTSDMKPKVASALAMHNWYASFILTLNRPCLLGGLRMEILYINPNQSGG